jgi:hypothetical protein
MMIPIIILHLLSSVAWLVIGIRGRKEIALLMLSGYWWMGSFVSAYFTWLAWQDRGYSENWAMIGFMFYSLPFLLTTGVLVAAGLISIRKWQGGRKRTLKWILLSLLIFLILQMMAGFLSA